jgi:Uncharacterized protein conserved in bacteria
VEISYDAAKCEWNLAERGLSFERAADFDFETALHGIDDRRDYGEVRRQALGWLDGRLHMLVYVETVTGIRVISFRRANKREARRYEQATRS